MFCGVSRQQKKRSEEEDSSGLSLDSMDNLLHPFKAMRLDTPIEVHGAGGSWGSREEYQFPSPGQARWRGQLKLAIYLNHGLLTVHVIQARHLNSKSRQPCDAYIKLCIEPDQRRRTQCRTDIITDTDSPVFDEKFSFELLQEDFHKRLSLSVWNRNKDRSGSELLGCMSFGVDHIRSSHKVINGWYYLLSEEVGMKKHLHAMSRQHSLMDRGQNGKNIPTMNQDVLWMDPVMVSMVKGSKGYGFSMTGCSPVVVSKVNTGSPADLMGLRKDDCIVAVNGQNVSRSSSSSIARLIKNCSGNLVLDVQRPRQLAEWECSPRRPLNSTMKMTSLPSDLVVLEEFKENRVQTSRPVLRTATLGRHCQERKKVTFMDVASLV